MKGDHGKIVRKLADAYDKKNKTKNRILTRTIALAVFLIYSVFAIISGKMDTDYLLYARNGGGRNYQHILRKRLKRTV